MTTPVIHATEIPTPRVDGGELADPARLVADIVGSLPPRSDRRTVHAFQEAEGSGHARAIGQVQCLICGYAEAAHTALTAPETKVVTRLVNQPQAPEFMRRSILRKLASTLRIR